jgi:fido (protein-threonine AMPylation protein)
MTSPAKIKEFIRESNAIENVWDEESVEQSYHAWEYLVKQDKLSNAVICKTHKILMINHDYPPGLGYYRDMQKWNVQVGGRVAPPWWMIKGLMDNWLLDFGEAEGVNERQAHRRFEMIHPFCDGNGRSGRLIYLWHRMKQGKRIHIIREATKQDYYRWFK